MEKNYTEIKNKLVVYLIGVIIITLIYTVFFGALKKYSNSLYSPRTFSVSAEGKTVATPDMATFSFSVVNEGSNPKTLADENNKKMKTAVDLLKNKGVNEKDIRTSGYNLNPRYEYDETSKKSYISGYTMTQTAFVKVREIGKVADILGALPEIGVNQISSISFEVDEPEKYLKEARDKAIEEAKDKAKTMAKKAGFSLGKIINLYEYQGGNQPVYYGESMKAVGMGGGDVAYSTPTIQAGSQEITVQASITYEIR